MIILLVLIFTVIALAVSLFVAIVVGIHSEPRREMTTRAQRLGVYVAKPADTDTGGLEDCLTG